MSARLRRHGAVPEEVPTISVEPPRTPQQMDRALQGLVSGRYLWVAFTSVNAVRAVREKFEEYGLDARAFAGIKVAAVGEQTAAALAAFGVRPDLVPSGEQSVGGLLEDFPEYDSLLDPIDRVFLPRADIATETLAAGLVELGWEVDDVTAYRTVRAAPPPADDPRRHQGAAASTRSSSPRPRPCATWSASPASRTPTTVIACIGPQTAKTAEEHGLRVDVLRRDAVRGGAGRCAGRVRRGAAAVGARGRARPTWRPSQRRGAARRKAEVGDVTARASRCERPRRLRRTPALRRLVAETSLSPADLVLPMFVKEGLAEPVADHVDARRRPAHPRLAAQGRARGGRGRGRRADPLRHPRRRRTPTGSQADAAEGVVQVALRDLAADLGDSTVVMADLCLCEYTDHGHCGPLDAAGEVDNDAHARALRRGRGGPGAGRGSRHRAVGHAGRPGRGDPLRRSTRPASPTSRSWPTPRSTPPPSTARSARRRSRRPPSATGGRTRWTRPTPSRRCARSRSTSPRAPTR